MSEFMTTNERLEGFCSMEHHHLSQALVRDRPAVACVGQLVSLLSDRSIQALRIGNRYANLQVTASNSAHSICSKSGPHEAGARQHLLSRLEQLLTDMIERASVCMICSAHKELAPGLQITAAKAAVSNANLQG